MPVTASGILSEPLAVLRTMLSESASFQTWVAAANAAAALASIYLIGTDAPVRPYAIVTRIDNWSSDLVGGSPGDYGFIGRGRLYFDFEDAIASGNQASYADSLLAFQNNVGAVIVDLQNASGGSERLLLRRFEMVAGPQRFDKTETNSDADALWCRFSVDYGLEA